MSDPVDIVAIVGAGPAGLLAAHAVSLAGGNPVLFDPRAAPPPPQPGVYLHKPIPLVTEARPDAQVWFSKTGAREEYALKVYGDREAKCSWDEFATGNSRPAWAVAPALETLWELYGDKVVPQYIAASEVPSLVDQFGLVISTAPIWSLCLLRGVHEFRNRTIYIDDELPAGVTMPGENGYVYNGEAGADWSRCGRLFGHEWTEFPNCEQMHERPAHQRQGLKPISTDCDCHPEVVRAGRFGTWQKGVLLTDAFDSVWKTMFDAREGR